LVAAVVGGVEQEDRIVGIELDHLRGGRALLTGFRHDTASFVLSAFDHARAKSKKRAARRVVQRPVGGRILIVDSDADGGAMLRGALRRRGYEVEAVASGASALAWLDTGEVDLVLAH